jgi:hypothetical protein
LRIPAAFLLLFFLAACGGRPHPVGYYDLVKIDDSLKAENNELIRNIQIRTQGAEDNVDNLKEVRMMKVKKEILEINRFLNDVKIEVFSKVDANYDSQATMMDLKDMQHPGEVSVTTHYFIGDDPENVTGKAKDIKMKLVQLKELLKTVAGNKMNDDAWKGIATGDETTEWDGKTKSWEVARFYKVNAAEAYVELTRLQNAVLKAGDEVISRIGKLND